MDLFTEQDWVEERALVLSRLGRHKQALHVYAEGMPERAESYCQKVYKRCPDVYGYLLGKAIRLASSTFEFLSPFFHLLFEYIRVCLEGRLSHGIILPKVSLRRQFCFGGVSLSRKLVNLGKLTALTIVK